MSKKYSLLVDYDGKKSVVKIKEFDEKRREVIEKDKVDLSTIDLLTTCFDDEDELKRYFELPLNSELKITYASKGELKEIPLVFEKNNLMRHFSYLAYAKSSLDEIGRKDPTFRTTLNRFYCLLVHSSIRDAVLKDRKINLYLKDKIRDYLEFSGNEQFILKKIEEEMLNYKNLRNVVLCLRKYEQDKKTELITFNVPTHDEVLPPEKVSLSRFVPDEDIEEPLFAPNSAEEKQYNRYMDSLKIENDAVYLEEKKEKRRK